MTPGTLTYSLLTMRAGRVTDDKDRRLLAVLLERVYSPDLLSEPNHPLSASGIYCVPDPGPREAHLQYIAGLPAVPLPEAFGLHDNAGGGGARFLCATGWKHVTPRPELLICSLNCWPYCLFCVFARSAQGKL